VAFLQRLEANFYDAKQVVKKLLDLDVASSRALLARNSGAPTGFRTIQHGAPITLGAPEVCASTRLW